MKDYKVAKLYYRMDDYAASITMLNNIIKDYPETPHKEEILYLIVKSYHKYAEESIFEKQKDRHIKAIIAYKEFVAQYPESKYMSEVATLNERSKKKLESTFTKDQNKANQENSGIQLYKPTK
jgi:outer membrane protein assembly factor BamD